MNLKSLADKLGMSKTTVSRALNGYPEVSELTRERVLRAARESGYEANPMARSLAVGRSNVLGTIYPLLPADLGDSMFLEVVGGMSEVLEQKRMNFIIAPVSPANEMPSYEQMVRGRRVDGLVVSRTLVHDERIAYLARAGFPFIAHGRTQLDAPYAWFDYDNEAGIRMALERLLSLGHQRIAMISAPLAMNFAAQRRASFLATLAGARLSSDPRHLVDDCIDRRAGHAAVQTLLGMTPRPTAIVVDNHLAGVGAVRALLDAGIAIGKDISLIVWGSMADTLADIDVTTIDQPNARAAGAKMADMLLARINGKPAASLQELWQPALLTGATTGPVVS
ncbi:substrate-binding domain-containing protein [Duganella sp. Root1480D1]|uniref:substrate-binding domain-containing protein n=1 Tax=Duganella sp. Root1480D1 TaxID=1736471 RepID=UPI00070A19F8|nr:substrate-binding domain-containing protein [Duganella sp. Root1480D1]KQZ25965.1 LacI family transcriptional regulator [Duganella sp. Root1480D1]